MADLHTEARAVRMYATTDMSQAEVGEEFGVAGKTISRWLDDHGPELESLGRQKGDPRLHNEDWLRKRYTDDGTGMIELAAELDCCTTAVLKALRRHDIKTRGRGCQVADPRLQDSKWLEERYIKDGASMTELANELDCTSNSVQVALARAGVETRPVGANLVHCDEYDVDLHSGWEHETAHALEDIGASWLAQEDYETDAGRYVADFRLPRQNVVIEVKGRVDYGDGATQTPKLRELMGDGTRIIVVGDDRAREHLPHDAFVEYTHDRDALAGALKDVVGLLSW